MPKKKSKDDVLKGLLAKQEKTTVAEETPVAEEQSTKEKSTRGRKPRATKIVARRNVRFDASTEHSLETFMAYLKEKGFSNVSVQKAVEIALALASLRATGDKVTDSRFKSICFETLSK